MISIQKSQGRTCFARKSKALTAECVMFHCVDKDLGTTYCANFGCSIQAELGTCSLHE